MALDLSSLEKAVGSLERALGVAGEMIHGVVNTPREDVVRAGVIQNFEFTYELCWKFMRRWLEANDSRKAVDAMTMREVFRLAAERGLVDDVEAWFVYQVMRNRTAHTYDARTADDVFKTAVRFLKDARLFLANLQAKND